MLRVVLDTNVYISGALYGGIPEEIIRFGRGRNKKIEPFLSSSILKEIGTVLANKFDWPEPRIAKVIKHLIKNVQVVDPYANVSVISDETDNRILECAIECQADYIISGDKHLLDLKEYKNIKIVKPSDFINLIKQ